MARLCIALLFGTVALSGCAGSSKPHVFPPEEVPPASNQSSLGGQVLPPLLPPW